MDRRERDNYNYDRYDGYNRDDEHYHRARNLTDEFERHYQRDSNRWEVGRGGQRIPHSYHEGDMGDAYEQLSREQRSNRADTYRSRDRYYNYGESFNPERDRYSNYRDEYDKSRDMIQQGRDMNQQDRRDRYHNYDSNNSGSYSSPRRSYGDAGSWAGQGTDYHSSPIGNFGEDRDSTYSRNSRKYDRYRNRYY